MTASEAHQDSMKIHEYQARDLFAATGIPVPPVHVATTPAEVKAISAEFGVPVVVKAQVLTGGRGMVCCVRR